MAMLPAGGNRFPHVTGRSVPSRGLRRSDMIPLDEWLVAAVAAIGGGAAMAGGTMLAARRLAGGFTSVGGLHAWVALAGGLLLILVSDAARRCGGSLLGSIASRVGVVVGVMAVAMPSKADDWISFLPAAAAVVASLVPPPRPLPPKRASPKPRRPASRPASRPISHRQERRPEIRLPGRLLQRQERFETSGGGECLQGHVVLAFAEGERATHAHVGFCPAFAVTPAVRVTTSYDGVEAVVTAAEVLPWGVRIECRLAEPAEEPLEIPVELTATTEG